MRAIGRAGCAPLRTQPITQQDMPAAAGLHSSAGLQADAAEQWLTRHLQGAAQGSRERKAASVAAHVRPVSPAQAATLDVLCCTAQGRQAAMHEAHPAAALEAQSGPAKAKHECSPGQAVHVTLRLQAGCPNNPGRHSPTLRHDQTQTRGADLHMSSTRRPLARPRTRRRLSRWSQKKPVFWPAPTSAANRTPFSSNSTRRGCCGACGTQTSAWVCAATRRAARAAGSLRCHTDRPAHCCSAQRRRSPPNLGLGTRPVLLSLLRRTALAPQMLGPCRHTQGAATCPPPAARDTPSSASMAADCFQTRCSRPAERARSGCQYCRPS